MRPARQNPDGGAGRQPQCRDGDRGDGVCDSGELALMKRLIPFAAAFLSACAPIPAPPPAPYHAVGTEPFWNLLIDERDLTFTQPEAQPIREPKPRVIIGIAGEIYQTPLINVNIVHGTCSDGM